MIDVRYRPGGSIIKEEIDQDEFDYYEVVVGGVIWLWCGLL